MKNSIVALLALSGMAFAETTLVTTPLGVLNDTYGTLIGSRNNTATVATDFIGPDSTYTGLTSLLVNPGEWYVTSGYITDLDGYAENSEAVILVSGGPNANSASGAIKFALDAETIAQYEGPITLTFDVKKSGGNNSKNHDFKFALLGNLGGEDFKTSVTYTYRNDLTVDPEGILLTDTAQKVELTLTAEWVGAMQTAGTDQTLVFLAATDQVTGGNQGVAMSNFALKGQKNVPEPATATLSLLALAVLAARRRRK